MTFARKIIGTALLGAALWSAAPARATVIYIDFEGIAPYPNSSNVLIQNYYNGGTSSIGTTGTNLGVQFAGGATLLCLNTAGTDCSNTSRGGQGIATSAQGALFLPNAAALMNVAAGFDTGFSFTYSNPFAANTTVSVYDGLNGTGNLLGLFSLGGTANGACDNSIAFGANYCPFVAGSVAFSGTAQSVVFGGTVNQQVFDDFTFGSVEVGGAVPEPATWAMMLLGFGAIGASMRQRKTVMRPAVS